MSRRSHPRFTVSPAAPAALRVLRDVDVQETGDRELIVQSVEPGVLSERLLVELARAGETRTLAVRVRESRPVVVDGAVRYRLRLTVLRGADDDGEQGAAR